MADDHELETFLRQFRPRSPGPLRRPRPRPALRRWILAAAAVVILATGIWRWAPGPEPPSDRSILPAGPSMTVSLTGLNAAMREGTHESVLDQVSSRVLPDPARPGGALRVLGDVTRDTRGPGTRRTR